MATLPAFELPSTGEAIVFTPPTVDTCIDFADLNADAEELATTDYLKALQEGEVSDPESWTLEDRTSAMWWIWLHISDETTLVYKYQCDICGEEHLYDLDLANLDAEYVRQLAEPSIPITFQAQGNDLQATVNPLRGGALHHLEDLRLARDTADCDKERSKRQAWLQINEMAHRLDIPSLNHIQDEGERHTAKVGIIRGMAPKTEFAALVAGMNEAIGRQRHGLNIQVKDGQARLITPPRECESKEGAGAMRLHVGFRPSQLIPAI